MACAALLVAYVLADEDGEVRNLNRIRSPIGQCWQDLHRSLCELQRAELVKVESEQTKDGKSRYVVTLLEWGEP